MKQADALARIRAAILGSSKNLGAREKMARSRLGSPPRHPLPAQAAPGADAIEAQFVSYLKAQGTVVIEAAAAQDIPASAARALAATGSPLRLRTGSERRFSSLDWDAAGIVRVTGAAAAEDAASLSHAIAGVAETGTLVLDSGEDNPTSLAFMPEVHLVALSREEIVGSYEEAMALVRAKYGKGAMPRALNFISGASRTGDIGGRIVKGAHGPRSLCVIVYVQGSDD